MNKTYTCDDCKRLFTMDKDNIENAKIGFEYGLQETDTIDITLVCPYCHKLKYISIGLREIVASLVDINA